MAFLSTCNQNAVSRYPPLYALLEVHNEHDRNNTCHITKPTILNIWIVVVELKWKTQVGEFHETPCKDFNSKSRVASVTK